MTADDARGQGRRADGETSDQQPPQAPTVEAAGDEAERVAGETVDQVGATTAQFPSEVGAARSPEARREPAATASTGRHAFLVGAGILLSRIVGLVRQRVFAHYLGTSDAMDARSEEHTSELQSRQYLVCRLLLEKKKPTIYTHIFDVPDTQPSHRP